MPRIFKLLACLLLFASVIQEISARTCRIIFLDRPADAPKNLYLFDGEKIQEVDLPRLNLSPVYQLPDGNLNLRFFLSKPAALEKIPEGAPSTKIPESTKDVYLLLMSDLKNKVAPVSIQAVSADSTNFSRGQMLWFNLTDKRVGGKIGSEKLDLKPLSRERVGEPRQGSGDYPVELYFVIQGDTHLHPLCETNWLHDPRSRSLVFVANNGNRRAPRVYSVSDFRMPEKKEGE
jgi:hypothetical protein